MREKAGERTDSAEIVRPINVSRHDLEQFISDSPTREEDVQHVQYLWQRCEAMFCDFEEEMTRPSFGFEKISNQKAWELSCLIGVGDEEQLTGIDVDSLAASVNSGKFVYVTRNEAVINIVKKYLKSLKPEMQPISPARSITGSLVIMHSDGMADKGILESQEVRRLQLDVWPRLENHYHSYVKEQRIPVRNLYNAEQAIRWQASGIEVRDADTHRLGAVMIESLIRSVATGAIRAITREDEQQVLSLAKFLEAYTNGAITPGNSDFSDMEKEIDDMKRRNSVMQDMIDEAHEQEYGGKFISGPYRDLFKGVNAAHLAELKKIHPNLTMDAFHAKDYRSAATRALVQKIKNPATIELLAKERLVKFEEIAEQTYDDDKLQIVPEGLLDRPRATGQDNGQACATAAFRMVFQGVTGHFVGEENIRNMLQKKYGSAFISDPDYLKLFETESFKDEYGKEVQSIVYGGMSLQALAAFVRKLREKQPESRIFASASLRTTALMPSLAQHRVVLLGASENAMQLIDPSTPELPRMDKKMFLRRWAGAQNSGYIIVSK